MTEVAVTTTQLSSKERTTTYATGSDFCRIFEEDLKSLYSLSLMLAADHETAERLFVSGLDDCSAGNPVFKEWARSWARRTIIKNAVRLIAPPPASANGVSNTVGSSDTNGAWPELPAEISALLSLSAFERFAFILSVLEGYSDQDSALLLGCTRQALIAARVRAEQEIARSVGAEDGRLADASLRNQHSVIKLTFPARLATSA
jgi:DNA-directed RNA polymerase specialized sigma24 family protein